MTFSLVALLLLATSALAQKYTTDDYLTTQETEEPTTRRLPSTAFPSEGTTGAPPSEFCNMHGHAYCKCDVGFEGEHCENPIDYCAQLSNSVIVDPGTNRTSICGEHGRCENKVQGAHCICDYGFTGEFCQHISGGYTLAKKCLVYAPTGGATAGPDTPIGCAAYPGEECVPEELDCFYRHCEYPVGWCIPVKQSTLSQFLKVGSRPRVGSA